MAASSLPPDNRELLAIVRAWSAANYPGCPLEYISIHLHNLPVSIRLADSHRPLFVPSAFQRAILAALEGKSLKSDALGAAVGDRSRLFKQRGGLKELKEHGRVAHHDRLGYYRPDFPPPELRE